ncbi:cytochrome b5 [Rhizoclosmatium globosum]|uniref:Cytochrome b5 n=1 Tax=Rhizoclosmatium globosum TaxID=329046 RepID=A0A1Y2C9R9_9FUNG|nr:Cytochrome b5 isoform E [Rhizoclosmatium hyalinum]ORY43065.1 cytochrome b5 [Rhizoclosmatium globosum]|eukprot:ORY43065.1 cytochrome b5 [Rhizoclosmatium globosum]
MSKTFTWADVQSHNTRKTCWLVIEKDVYDCTKFLEEHPGGEEVMMENAGFDATDAFEEIGHSDDARDLLKGMKIGTLVDSVSSNWFEVLVVID